MAIRCNIYIAQSLTLWYNALTWVGGLINFYDASGLDPVLSEEVNNLFYRNFNYTTDLSIANIVLCGVDPISPDLFPLAKYFVCPCTNVNHINVKEVIHLDDKDFLHKIRSTAEHTIYLILSLLKPQDDRSKPGYELYGKTVGVIGMGRVGGQVARRCRSFGCVVNYCDIALPHNTLEIVLGSDIISVHASIVKDQKPILNSDNLKLIKDGAYVVNTTRSEAIDHNALLSHMDRLGGFATDVMDYSLLSSFECYDNFRYTGHVAGFRKEALKKTSEHVFHKLIGRIEHEDG